MSIDQFVDNDIKGNVVMPFMKGTPHFPCAASRARWTLPSPPPFHQYDTLPLIR